MRKNPSKIEGNGHFGGFGTGSIGNEKKDGATGSKNSNKENGGFGVNTSGMKNEIKNKAQNDANGN